MTSTDTLQRYARDLRRVIGFAEDAPELDILVSALTETSGRHRMEELEAWLASMNERQFFRVERRSLAALDGWKTNPATGDIEHTSGAFFAVRGMRVERDEGPIASWTQPALDQPDVGLLGIVSQKIDGVLHFLMQAKAEPGTLHSFQISPTVQATWSNYTRKHGGKSPPYVGYFTEGRSRALFDQLESEQGSTFFQKRNRNIIVQVNDDEDVPVSENHRWMTLGQVLRFLHRENRANTCARSVLSAVLGAPRAVTHSAPTTGQLLDVIGAAPFLGRAPSAFGLDMLLSAHGGARPAHSLETILHALVQKKIRARQRTKRIPLRDLEGWVCTEDRIFREDGRYFSVFGVHVEADNREVLKWDQPVMDAAGKGLHGLLVKRIGGVAHLLVQCRTEGGLLDSTELGPTVQCIPENYDAASAPPFVDLFSTTPSGKSDVLLDVDQSEEGGRFYEVVNRTVVRAMPEDFAVHPPAGFLWVTLGQLKELVRFGGLVDIQLRSVMACLPWG